MQLTMLHKLRYNPLSPNQLLSNNGLTQTVTLGERWTMEAQCGGMAPIGKSMLDPACIEHKPVQ
jgi:hypothetical protein